MEICEGSKMKLTFEILEKKYPETAEAFLEDLKLLPIFLNYFKEVQDKWLLEIGLNEDEIHKVRKTINKYWEIRDKIEKERPPKDKKEEVLIEDKALRQVFEGKFLKIESKVKNFENIAETIVKSENSNCVVISPSKLKKLEKNLLFAHQHGKVFPENFLVFDPFKGKIILYEVIQKEE